MTLANKITIFRILLVPLFIVEMLYYVSGGESLHYWLAVTSFAMAAISDGIDGFLARRFNQRSELGRFLDPLADKLLLVSGVVLLSLNNRPYFDQLPLWVTATILCRDVLIVIGLIVIHYAVGKVRFRTRISGKIATVMQMAVVLWALFQWSSMWFEFLAMAAALFTFVSGMFYIYDAVTQLSASPSSSAAPDQ